MAKHTRHLSDEQRKRLDANRETMLCCLTEPSAFAHMSVGAHPVSLTLERFVCDAQSGAAVPYEGSRGVERLLAELGEVYQQGRIVREGHLVGVAGTLAIEGRDHPVGLRAEVGPGGQLALEVGPSSEASALLAGIQVFDRQVHVAGMAMGRTLELVAQGYHPAVSSPSEIVLVPQTRFTLMNTHLSQTGRFARDAMRCCAATIVSLPVDASTAAADAYRLAAALAPVLAFLTDNSLRLRGSDPRQAPRMARALMWEETDPTRCGTVPGALSEGFGPTGYLRWLEGVQPVVFASDDGVSFATGTDTIQRVLEERTLSRAEAAHLLATVFPDVRWGAGSIELRCSDALPPRLAAGYAALIKGVISTQEARNEAAELIGLDRLDESSTGEAWSALRSLGWSAAVYGCPVGKLADGLAHVARRALPEMEEHALLEGLTQLWEARMVPRDTLVTNWERSHTRDSAAEAAELYGAGAVIPYDELAGEPPAGATAVLRFD